jgi:hypothetical protein
MVLCCENESIWESRIQRYAQQNRGFEGIVIHLVDALKLVLHFAVAHLALNLLVV